jgi:hypothetical protein
LVTFLIARYMILYIASSVLMVVKSCWMMGNGIVAPWNELPRTSPMKRGVSVSIVQVLRTRHQPIMISYWLKLGARSLISICTSMQVMMIVPIKKPDRYHDTDSELQLKLS